MMRMMRKRQSTNLPSTPNTTTSDSDMHTLISNVRKNTTATIQIDSKWNEISQRCQTHPHEASKLDARGRTCLHAACAQQAPLLPIQHLLKLCKTETALLETDKHGRTPLSIAIASRASIAVIRLLLHTNTDAAKVQDSHSSYPLDLACHSYNRDDDHEQEENRQFMIVTELLAVWPDAAGFKEQGYKTPIYTAIEGGAHPNVIRMLAQASPDAVAGKNNTADTTPLLIAIRNNASPETIRILIETKPDIVTTKDQDGKSPLQHAIEHRSPASIVALLCPTVDDIVARNKFGKMALHLALELNGNNHAVIKTLLDKCSSLSSRMDVANLSTNLGYTPLSMAYSRYVQSLQSGSGCLYGTNTKDFSRMSSRSKLAWKTVVLLLRSSHNYHRQKQQQHYDTRCGSSANKSVKWECVDLGDYDNDDDNDSETKFQILHTALATDVPLEIIQTAMSLHPTSIQQTDYVSGAFPISIALSGPLTTNKNEIVQCLFDAYPSAVSTPDANGNYPLFYAAYAAGTNHFCKSSPFHSRSSNSNNNNNKKKGEDGEVLFTIFKAYPDAIFLYERDTRLYPFMLAALSTPPNHGEEKKEKETIQTPSFLKACYNGLDKKRISCYKYNRVECDLRQLNAIYHLLRAGPGLLCGIVEELG